MSPRAGGRRRGLPARAAVAAPADRRFRRPDVRPGRRRPVARALRLLVRVGLPVVVLAGGSAWAGRAILDSPLLHVDRIVVHGTSRLAPADVAALVPDLPGAHILAVDFDESRREVLASPWIEDVTLSRVLPSTIEITVRERQPIAVARLGQELLLVDAHGVVIEPDGPAHGDLDLPIVDGLGAPTPPGQPVPHGDGLRLAVRFLDAIGAAPALRERISQLDVTNPRDAVVLIDGDPAWLHLGDQAFVERLRRYLEWAPALRDGMPDLDYVDLRFGERVVVRAGGRRTEWSKD